MKIFVISASRLNQIYPEFGDTLLKYIKPATGNRCMLHNESISDFFHNTGIPEMYKHILNYFNLHSSQRGYACVLVTKEEEDLASSAS